MVGAMSFIGASLYYLDGIRYEKDQFGLEATKWIINTGIQDEGHFPVPSKHYVHMMRSSEMDALFADSALENARQDKEFWKLIIEKEIAFTKLQGTHDCGMNIIYVLEKNN